MSVSSYTESRFFFFFFNVFFKFQITNGKHAFDKPEACSSQGLKETSVYSGVSCISLAILLSLPLVFIGVCLFFFSFFFPLLHLQWTVEVAVAVLIVFLLAFWVSLKF